ncbi:Acg family FMN-binding oxidoreductase [Pseudaestuariivita sp.]|uniref:Acg family FMN-binding oxidoreductase n=1 Tax=Pseudaestuariivita sp. TaxID=2211669 RepID=UPI00405A1467
MTSLTRRKTLALIGGGVVVAAAAGTASIFRPAHAAVAPWAAAGQFAEPRMRALSWAILAPNPHNRQPWQVDLNNDGEVHLYVDTERLLPHTDPFSRQITIGLGCFLETFDIAAAADGFGVETALFTEGADPERLDARPVAVMKLVPGGAEPDADFGLIPHRRSAKEPYAETPVTDAQMAELVGSARHGSRAAGTAEPRDVQALVDLSVEAMLLELTTPHTYKESVDLFRIGRREVNANPDGIDLAGPLFEVLRATGFFSREAALDPEGFAFQSGVEAVLANLKSAGGHVWLTSEGNTRVDQIAAGRDWMRMNLAATRLGLGVHPLSQALQEYPEMAAHYADIHRRLAKPGETVQMWARVGIPPEIGPSPRWPVEAKIVNA